MFSLITFIATQQSVTLGAVSFFVVGLGMGLPFLVLGLLTSQINRFPRSGGWLVWVKQAMGLVLAGLILYYIQRFIDPAFFRLLVLALFVFAAVYLGFLEGWSRRPFTRRFWAVRIVTALAGAGRRRVCLQLDPGRTRAAGRARNWPGRRGRRARWSRPRPRADPSCSTSGPTGASPARSGTRAPSATRRSSRPPSLSRIEADVTKPEGALKEFAEKIGGLNPPLVLVIGRDGRTLKSYRDPPKVQDFLQALQAAAI